ncbi:hypothetical protein evm_000926 [Chilo suppressalis]|nr:hypothetical protein evm_000926 [Chilo suppressalis]
MKHLVVFVACISLCYGSTVSRIPYDNSHYVDGESRFIWMPRDDGELVLVDLWEDINNRRESKTAGASNLYWLYTRRNPEEYQLLIHGNESSIINSNFQADKPTIVQVHGWSTTGGNSLFNRVTKKALLEVEDYNIIVVDWRAISTGSYVVSVNAVPSVGESIGLFVDWLLATTGGSWNKVHLIGFSLGAHAIGNAGRAAGGRAARLTGFDPAGPLWRLNSNRLASSNGQYVEAIHTNAGVMGILIPVGDVDFYPNGGALQPGCGADPNCHHDRAYEFFAASISTGHLVGQKCEDLTEATAGRCSGTPLSLGGTDLNKRASGLYAMRTGDTWPF